MSRPQTFISPSLAQQFECPDEFKGCFGWLCGYSGDVPFLNDAAERFTQQTHAQRAYTGRIALAVMLDASNEQIPPTAAPGIAHLPLKHGSQGFRLLHAKVALLAFRHEAAARKWLLRLIISTGNWTRQTLEESLDLAWRVELSEEELREPDGSIQQTCADIRATWDMFSWLRQRVDSRILAATPQHDHQTETMIASNSVEAWIGSAIEVGQGSRPHFFDNRTASLLSQLPSMIRHHSRSAGARNYLALGSGFYEATTDNNEIPSVLMRTVETLRDEGLLTQRPNVDVFVNPRACQAVAQSAAAFSAAGWHLRPANKPDFLGPAARSLHAKFVFGANERDNSPICNSAWLYLGSGNLTGPGFANPMSPAAGNLEAGVVIAPESLHWFPGRNVEGRFVLTNLLPLQWDQPDLNETPDALNAGNPAPELKTRYFAAPIAYLLWAPEGHAGWLKSAEDIAAEFEVLDGDGNACDRDEAKRFRWPGPRPREVTLRFQVDGQQWHVAVPVVDEFGRIAATILPALGIDEVWGQLANFPMPPDEEELVEGTENLPCAPTDSEGGVGESSSARYPVRQVMQLIENIAAKQTAVSQMDWSTWCTRLEQCLVQMKDSKALEAFLRLKLNPISPLWHAPFRPDFATTAETTDGAMYETILRRVEAAWNVSALANFGGHP